MFIKHVSDLETAEVWTGNVRIKRKAGQVSACLTSVYVAVLFHMI